MNNEIDIIKRFINDVSMSTVVHKFLLDAFMEEESSKDIAFLAASRISIDKLNATWRKMEALQHNVKQKDAEALQIGL